MTPGDTDNPVGPRSEAAGTGPAAPVPAAAPQAAPAPREPSTAASGYGQHHLSAPPQAPKPRTRAEAIAAQATAKAIVEPPSEDVVVAETSRLPGEHRGGFSRLPTEPVGITLEHPETEPVVLWAMPEPKRSSLRLAAWALGFAIAAVAVALFVGWGFPLGLIAVVTAILSLRRPRESRAVAVWALALGVLSLIYSAGWLLWAASRANLFG